MQNIRIEMPKGIEEGQTSLSPASPTRSNVGSPAITQKGVALLTVGTIAASQTLNVISSELRGTGNESNAVAMENSTKAFGLGYLVFKTKGAAILPLGIGALAKGVERTKEVIRTNQELEFERSMSGSRITYGMGVGYE